MIQCRDLLGTDSIKIQNFKNDLKKLNVEIDILIHPFYSKETTPTSNNRYVKTEYLKKMDIFVKDCLSNKIPLIIFQQERDYLDLVPKLETLGEGIVYTIKTEMGQHYPIGGDESWEEFIRFLNISGISHVKLGGMYLVNYTVKDAIQLLDPKYETKNTLMNYVKNIPSYIKNIQLLEAG